MPLISIRDESIFSMMCELDLTQGAGEERRRQERRDRETDVNTKYSYNDSSLQCWNVALLKVSDEKSWSDEHWKTLLKHQK